MGAGSGRGRLSTAQTIAPFASSVHRSGTFASGWGWSLRVERALEDETTISAKTRSPQAHGVVAPATGAGDASTPRRSTPPSRLPLAPGAHALALPVFARLLSPLLALALAVARDRRPSSSCARPTSTRLPSKPADARIAYGADSLQFGELRLPNGKGPFPVAIVIHGGCWVHGYAAANNAAPIADALRDAGVATWNIEYRRRDNPGGGWPGTFLDVASAADSLRSIATRYPLDLSRVIAIGHSAGGSARALARRAQEDRRRRPRCTPPIHCRSPASSPSPARATCTTSTRTATRMCGDGTIPKLLGGTPERGPRPLARRLAVDVSPVRRPAGHDRRRSPTASCPARTSTSGPTAARAAATASRSSSSPTPPTTK